MDKDKKTKSATDEIKNKQIETYAEDMAKIIESDTGGLIKKIIHQQEQYEIERKNLSPKSKKNQFFIFSGIVLVFLAIILLISLGVFKDKAGIVELMPQYTPPIFVDQNYFKEIEDLTKEQVAQSVLNEVNDTSLKRGGVEGIYLTENKKIIGFKKFIEIMEGNLSAESFALIDDNFLIGVTNDTTRSVFFLLKVRSFPDIFPPFRLWEEKLFNDLHVFFRIDISSDTKHLLTKSFEDGLIANKNARILKDVDGTIIMMYVFADDKSVIITNSGETATEVVIRLTGSQIKK